MSFCSSTKILSSRPLCSFPLQVCIPLHPRVYRRSLTHESNLPRIFFVEPHLYFMSFGSPPEILPLYDRAQLFFAISISTDQRHWHGLQLQVCIVPHSDLPQKIKFYLSWNRRDNHFPRISLLIHGHNKLIFCHSCS